MLMTATLFLTIHFFLQSRDDASAQGLPTTCKDHNDCEDQALCSNGVCELGIPSYKHCDSNEECGESGLCMYGLCWLLSGNLCPEGKVLYTAGYNQCKILPERSEKDSACPNGYYCNELNGYCCSTSIMTGLGGNCSSSKCEDPNAYCISGICTCRPGYSQTNGTCARQGKRLHQSCALDVECEAPYSRCQNKTCECPDGLREDRGNCKPSSYYCPFGQPVIHSGKILECKIMKFLLSQKHDSNQRPDGSIVGRATTTQQYYMDSCPSSSYCVTYGSPTVTDSLSNSVATSGYCCPKLKSNCPVGVEIKIPKGLPCELACPIDTHFCFVTPKESKAQICCPMPCMKGEFYTDGKCVQQKAVGQPCTSDEECLSHNSKCLTRNKQTICWCETDEVQYRGNCMIPTCPEGRPMRNKAGKYIRCTDHCPSPRSFCHDQFQVCCPDMV